MEGERSPINHGVLVVRPDMLSVQAGQMVQDWRRTEVPLVMICESIWELFDLLDRLRYDVDGLMKDCYDRGVI